MAGAPLASSPAEHPCRYAGTLGGAIGSSSAGR
jgi:hypothetical protein